MNELNDLRTRGVETWVQTQKVLEKEMSDEETRHEEETEKAKEERKKGRKKNLKKLRKKLVIAQKAQIAQHPHAREIARKIQIRAEACIRLTRALRMKTKNVGLTLPQFQCKDGVSNLPQGLDEKPLKTDHVRCIELNGRFLAIKRQFLDTVTCIIY